MKCGFKSELLTKDCGFRKINDKYQSKSKGCDFICIVSSKVLSYFSAIEKQFILQDAKFNFN